MGLRDTITSLWKGSTKALGGFGATTGEDSFLSRWVNPGKYNPAQYLEQYQNYVYACITPVAESVGRTKFFTAINNMKAEEPEEDQSHPVMGMLQRPNPDMSGFQFMEMTQTHLDLTGESFWYIAKGETSQQPQQLYLLRPDLMYIKIDENTGLVTGYLMRKPDLSEVDFDKDEIIHFKTPNPRNMYRGMGIIEAAMGYVQTEDYATQYTKNSIYNNALPSGIISVPTNDEQEFKQFKKKWKEEYGTLERANKLAFVRSTDIKFQQIGAGLDSVGLVALKQMTRDDIMAMFHMSKPMLGIVDDVNLNNGENAKRLFAEYVVLPRLRRIIDTINSQLMPRYGTLLNGSNKWLVDFKNPVQDDVASTVTTLNSAVDSFITINEARAIQKAWPLEPIEGGDAIRRPVNLVEVGDEPEDEPSSAGGKKDDSAEEQPENGTPPKANDEPAEEETTTPPAAKSKKKGKQFELTTAQKENYRKQMYLHAGVWQEHYKTAVDKVFSGLKAQAVAAIKSNKKAGNDQYNGALPDSDAVVQGMTDATAPIALDIMAQAGNNAMTLIGASQVYAPSAAAKKAISTRIDKWASDLSDNLKSDIVDAITTTAQNGGSVADIKAAVSDAYDNFSDVSSDRIARTETSKYANMAANDAYQQSGLVSGKEWFANPGACQFCQALNGKVVNLDDNYAGLGGTITGTDGGTFAVDFEDIGEPPAHVNCECTTLPVSIEV